MKIHFVYYITFPGRRRETLVNGIIAENERFLWKTFGFYKNEREYTVGTKQKNDEWLHEFCFSLIVEETNIIWKLRSQ